MDSRYEGSTCILSISRGDVATQAVPADNPSAEPERDQTDSGSTTTIPLEQEHVVQWQVQGPPASTRARQRGAAAAQWLYKYGAVLRTAAATGTTKPPWELAAHVPAGELRAARLPLALDCDILPVVAEEYIERFVDGGPVCGVYRQMFGL